MQPPHDEEPDFGIASQLIGIATEAAPREAAKEEARPPAPDVDDVAAASAVDQGDAGAADGSEAAGSGSPLAELGATMSESETLLLQQAAMHEQRNDLDQAVAVYEQVLQHNQHNVGPLARRSAPLGYTFIGAAPSRSSLPQMPRKLRSSPLLGSTAGYTATQTLPP